MSDTRHACGCVSYEDGRTWTCPTHLARGEQAPSIEATSSMTGVVRSQGRLCHCDGPAHRYDPSWCGPGGPK